MPINQDKGLQIREFREILLKGWRVLGGWLAHVCVCVCVYVYIYIYIYIYI